VLQRMASTRLAWEEKTASAPQREGRREGQGARLENLQSHQEAGLDSGCLAWRDFCRAVALMTAKRARTPDSLMPSQSHRKAG
jgi:hypothetical protein